MAHATVKNILLALLLLPSLLMAGLADMCRHHELQCSLDAPSCCHAAASGEQRHMNHQHHHHSHGEQDGQDGQDSQDSHDPHHSQEHRSEHHHSCDHKPDPITSESPDRALLQLIALHAIFELVLTLDWNSGQVELAPLDTEPPLARVEILSSYRPLLI